MCRVLSYLGKPIVVNELLYEPDNSFIKQSYNPKLMSHLLNLAGFGMAAWQDTSQEPQTPYLYKTPHLPFYDGNLKNLASKIKPHCFLAHIRGVSYNEKQIISAQNVHPFIFKNTNIALAHNGSLSNFDEIKFDLLEHIHVEYKNKIHGTTDSEYIYAIFLSQLNIHADLKDPEVIADAIINTLKILQKVRQKHNVAITSPVNLFITNGEFIAATRYTLDFGWQSFDEKESAHMSYHSLWYTFGESYGFYDNEYKMKSGKKKTGIIIASEPLTQDTTTWIEIPEYTFIMAWRDKEVIKIVSKDIMI